MEKRLHEGKPLTNVTDCPVCQNVPATREAPCYFCRGLGVVSYRRYNDFKLGRPPSGPWRI